MMMKLSDVTRWKLLSTIAFNIGVLVLPTFTSAGFFNSGGVLALSLTTVGRGIVSRSFGIRLFAPNKTYSQNRKNHKKGSRASIVVYKAGNVALGKMSSQEFICA